MRLTCPHCNVPALSAVQKLLLGPVRSVPCRSCGLKVTVAPLPATASMLPCTLVVLAAALRWMRDPMTLALAGAGAITCTIALYLWAVPLARAQLTDIKAVQRALAQGR